MQLAQGEADAPADLVRAEHHDLDLLANFEDVFGTFDVIPGKLADVEQALDAVCDLQERTVFLGLGDDAGHRLAGRELLLDGVPGIL